MVHLVTPRCAGASVAPQLVAELVQASIFVLIEAAQAVRPASCPLPRRGRQLPGPFACARCTAQTARCRRFCDGVIEFLRLPPWVFVVVCRMCPHGRQEWGSASAVTFHGPCMVMGDTWEHSEPARTAGNVHTD